MRTARLQLSRSQNSTTIAFVMLTKN